MGRVSGEQERPQPSHVSTRPRAWPPRNCAHMNTCCALPFPAGQCGLGRGPPLSNPSLGSAFNGPCSADGCQRMAAKSGLCWGHRKQRQRGKELGPLRPYGNARLAVLEAAISYADADSQDDTAFRRLWDRLRKGMKRYVATTRGKP